MEITLDNANALIRTLLRTIDKKIEYNVADATGDASRVSVSLALRKCKGTVSLRVADLAAAERDLMRRNQVRALLKRAVDRMMFRPMPVASTAMLRPDSQADGFFRASFSGRRRR